MRMHCTCGVGVVFFFKQKTAYELRISDWSSDVCSSDLFTEELVGLFFSALIFLALPYVTLHRQHIEVTLLTDRYPPVVRRWSDRLANGLVILFAVWFGTFALDFAFVSYQVQARTDIAGVTLWPWMALIVVVIGRAHV